VTHVELEPRLVAGYAIFAASYLVFALGKFPGLKIDRPGAAIIGAVAMVAARVVPPGAAVAYVDLATLVLLFSMMLVVGSLQLAGFFEWSAELVLRRLRPSALLPAVVFTSGVLSAFFVNDIVCLVMTPFVLGLARRTGRPPMPYLLALATASNIGSVATITGNPQNMLIGSFSGIPYREFLLRLGPVALVGLFLDWAIVRALHRRELAAPREAPATIPLPALDLSRLAKPVAVVAAVLVAFFLGVPPAMAAALGAATILVTRTREPRRLYERVDWGLLVFFVGLFIVVGGADRIGVTERLLGVAERWNLHRPAVFTATVAVLSNAVSNVPAVMLLKGLVPTFPDPKTAWLLLAMASTLAGNLTLTGSVANLIVAESARSEVRIGFGAYLRVGVPVTAATLLVGWLWLSF
jgi:Na+/H+ antiporter NhaD/arsenite permease-like protein